jgi:prolyl 4-hydroxylase
MLKTILCFLFMISCYGELTLVQISEDPRIFILKGFLTDAECNHVIEVAKPNLVASKIVDEANTGEVADKRRSSRGFFIPREWNDSILRNIEKRISNLTNTPVKNGENLHVLHYDVGGEFQPHCDFFNPTPGGKECARFGGQRVATVVMYLNTPEAGGETVFPYANYAVQPKKGDAVLFYNLTPDGEVDPHSLHGGSPVKAGEKWIMTKWIREREFVNRQ